MITQKRLKEILAYDPSTGIFTNRIHRSSNALKGEKSGYIDTKDNSIVGYNRIYLDGKIYFLSRLAWLYVYGYMPENFIDHINRNTLDDRITNLREVSTQCNNRNAKTPHTNKSGVKGVHYMPDRGKWKAAIGLNGMVVYLGAYKDFTEAVCHRLAAEQCLDWVECEEQSPAYKYVSNFRQSGFSHSPDVLGLRPLAGIL